MKYLFTLAFDIVFVKNAKNINLHWLIRINRSIKDFHDVLINNVTIIFAPLNAYNVYLI
jgi:hypothetical protein